MKRPRRMPVLIAAGGCLAVVIGVFQGLVHVAPGYEGTIMSGWDGPLSHEEVLLVGVSVLGFGGAVLARRRKRLASVPIAAGGVVCFYVVRAVYGLYQSPRPLYREFAIHGAGFEGDAVMLVLGAEPFLLALGGLSLVGAGLLGFTASGAGGRAERPASSSKG